jgi:predicted AAA+ superfamily ATPase
MVLVIDRILKNSLSNSPKSILLLGPRQVGKSTLCKSLPLDHSIDLADQTEYLSHAKDPSLLRRQMQGIIGHNLLRRVLIDEVQRLPTLLNTIQALLDAHPQQLQFFITGSSSRKLKRGRANLLPGRVLMETLFPLCYWEIAENFNHHQLLRCLTIGCLPEVYLQKTYGADLLQSYVETYLREEIQAEALTKDLGSYGRFLDLAAELSGSYLNYSKIASDTEINKVTIRRYFEILEETLLIHKLASFTATKSRRRVRQKEKFLFFDLGVRNAILKKQQAHFTNVELGGLFEQWVILQIIAYNQYYKKNWRLSTFRDEYGNEVDLIIETSKEIFAIEIKFSERYRPEQAKGLQVFASLIKRKPQPLIVYNGISKQIGNFGELVIPFQEFFNNLLPSW